MCWSSGGAKRPKIEESKMTKIKLEDAKNAAAKPGSPAFHDMKNRLAEIYIAEIGMDRREALRMAQVFLENLNG